ncbi:unnamed protein product [Musa acuminata subsp. malaccensis]|uniref:(wild Malaysian banana) hypothetical protein n=1 Tax=Musa acuminata subsp. malaccensis TaxID=214687 RepID=A0A8D7AI65_MUSAM|nr:unnamed protein product [Musa acuminata subsp. malaccensis]
MEFRRFARCRRLIAISQREVTNCYHALLDRRHHILPLIQTFFSEVVGPTFESQNYTFDVYVTTRLVEFRIVESQCGVRPGLKTAVPYDYLDTREGSGWDQFLRRADEELRKQAQTILHPSNDA